MVTGKVVCIEQSNDLNKNLIIWVEFTQDKTPIPFVSGGSVLTRNGVPVWPLYARYENFIGKDAAAVQKWVQVNVEYQIGNIIREQLTKEILNTESLVALEKMVGQEFSSDTVDIPVDTLASGTNDAVISLKADGSYLVK
jgi:hypothetical protein